MYFKDDEDFTLPQPSNVRKGRFLWMSENDRREYIAALKEKIAEGFYFSDRVISEVVNEIAPTIDGTVSSDQGPAPVW
jgi:hypothetical protein